MPKILWFLLAIAAVISLLIWTGQREDDGAAAAGPLPAPAAEHVTGASRDGAVAMRERTPEVTPHATGAAERIPAPDPELVARLGLVGHVEIRIVDTAGEPLVGYPVMAVPEPTWRWLGVDPMRAANFLDNIRANPSLTHPTTDEQGRARLQSLPRDKPLIIVSGGGSLLPAASEAFHSGSAEDPVQVQLTLHARTQLAVRARGKDGASLPLLQVRVIPDAASGMPARRFPDEPSRRASKRILCTALPGGVRCEVEATALVAGALRHLRGTIVLPPGGEAPLDLIDDL